jgi:hypothetical protein
MDVLSGGTADIADTVEKRGAAGSPSPAAHVEVRLVG